MKILAIRCCAVCVSICLLLPSNSRADLLLNGSFEQPGPTDPTIFNGIGAGGLSAAEHWTVFNNTNGSTETEQMLYSEALLPPIFPNNTGAGGDHVIRVETTGNHNGIVQVFGALNTGPLQAKVEAWIYVNSGVVGTDIGNGGLTSANNMTTMTGVWEKMMFTNINSPVNEIVFYAIDGPAEFYVDLASVKSVPEPGAIGIVAGLSGLAFLRRRR